MGVTTILSTKLTGYSMTKLTMFGFRCRVLRRMIPQVIVLSTLVLRSLSRRKARPVEAGSREWRKVEKMILKDNRYKVDDDTFEAEKLNRNHTGRATVTIVSVKRCKAYNEGNWSFEGNCSGTFEGLHTEKECKDAYENYAPALKTAIEEGVELQVLPEHLPQTWESSEDNIAGDI